MLVVLRTFPHLVALGEAFEEMRKVELLGERDRMRERPEEDEQGDLDAVGMMRNSASA